MSASPFLNTQAVETWDTWFRWRERGQLRDLTIEYTWERVAAALASRSGAARAGYQRRLFDAFCAWQLLLDERVLATAGTATPQWNPADLCAVLNIASFVRAPGLAHASIDFAHIQEISALAVYALDDAVHLANSHERIERLRIGMIGLADALASLGLPYDSAAACDVAKAVARAVADGCLAGSVALARDGIADKADADWLERARTRGFAKELIDAVERYGLRYLELTAITSQQRLACFANGVADALDPLLQRTCAQSACGTPLASHGTNIVGNLPRAKSTAVAVADAPCVSVPAQLQLRAAVQPWMDQRIQYPLVTSPQPDAETLARWTALAAELDLAPISLQSIVRDCRRTPATPTLAT